MPAAQLADPEPVCLRVVAAEPEQTIMEPVPEGPKGFAKMPHAWTLNPDLGHVAFRMAALLLYLARGRGECNPSNDDLASALRISNREVKRRLNELETAGIIARTYKDAAKRNRDVIIMSRDGVVPREGHGGPSTDPPPDPPIRKYSENIENGEKRDYVASREDRCIGDLPSGAESDPGTALEPIAIQADPAVESSPAHDRAAALAAIIHTAQDLHGMAVDRWASEYAHLYADSVEKTARILAAIRAARDSIDAGVKIRSVGGYIHTIYRRLESEAAHPPGESNGSDAPLTAAPIRPKAEPYVPPSVAARLARIAEWDEP